MRITINEQGEGYGILLNNRAKAERQTLRIAVRYSVKLLHEEALKAGQRAGRIWRRGR